MTLDAFLAFFTTHNVILTAALAFGLGTWVYFERRQDARNVTLGGLLVAVSLWSFAFVLWRMAPVSSQALFWLRTLFFIGSVLPVLYYFFAHSFLYERLPSPWVQLLMFLPNAALLWLAYWTDLLVQPAEGLAMTFGPGRTIFAVHFAIFIIGALVIFSLAARRDRSLDRQKLASVLVGTIISFDVIFAVLFGSRLTATADSFWIGNTALLLGMFVIAMAVIHNKLIVDLRLVSIELFLLITLFVVIADVVISQNVLDFTLRLAIMIVLIFYGVFTSRNMVNEVRHLRELQALTEHVTKMNGRLLEADKAKTRFVSLASHQFRAPLGGIRSYLDMLANGDFGSVSIKQKEVISLNIGVVNQLLETIETFLDATKIELGKLELYRSETDLRELAGRVIKSIEPLAERKQLAVVSDLPASLPRVVCDSGKIYHVLINLIDNAIKYTAKGTIVVSAAQEGDKVRVSVQDTGAGMAPEEIERLFQSFKRGLAGVTLNHDGSGLGLFIVKNIIDAHGGEVGVTSPGKGQGSTFFFVLPTGETPSVVAPLLTAKSAMV